MMNLRTMKVGQSGLIAAVRINGPLGQRLREMGLLPGTKITVAGRAPLYDPVMLRVCGQTLALRGSEAGCIEVETGGGLK